MKWFGTKNLGMLLLGIWLIITGVLPFLHLDLSLMAITSVLAIAAGVCILLGVFASPDA